jgi:hypothetical protein
MILQFKEEVWRTFCYINMGPKSNNYDVGTRDGLDEDYFVDKALVDDDLVNNGLAIGLSINGCLVDVGLVNDRSIDEVLLMKVSLIKELSTNACCKALIDKDIIDNDSFSTTTSLCQHR